MYNPQMTAERIKKMLVDSNMTSAKLNEVCSLNKNTIATSANSKNGLSAKILFDIAEQLHCSVDYLLGRTENPQAHKNNSTLSVSNVSGNSGAIGVGNTVTNSVAPLDEYQTRLLELFSGLSIDERAELLSELKNKHK